MTPRFLLLALLLAACGGASLPLRTPVPPPDPAIAEAAREALAAAENVSRGAVVVLDATNGQVLALVGRGPLGDQEGLRVAPTGSTWKALTVAAALEAGLDPARRFEDLEGRWGEGAAEVRDWEPRPWHDARSTIVHSSNVGAALILHEVGPSPLLTLVDALALREPIELPLGIAPATPVPSAVAWNLPVPDWGRLAPQARPWAGGIGMEATPLHLAVAYAAIANDGITYAPTPDGTGGRLRALRSETARAVQEMLVAAVLEGTGGPAGVEGVRVGGKTGTSRFEGGGGALFAGFFPPRRVAVVRVEGSGELYGGGSAGPVFRDLVQRLAAQP
ncbi:MAG: penicillin-binding transpeptidase domain-containing protein [Myxococcota bacterium]